MWAYAGEVFLPVAAPRSRVDESGGGAVRCQSLYVVFFGVIVCPTPRPEHFMYHKAFSARLSLVIACGLLALTPGVVQAQTTVTEIRNESDTPLLRLQDAGSGAALFSLGNVAPDRPLTLRGRSTSDADQFMSFYDAAGNAQWHLNWMTTP